MVRHLSHGWGTVYGSAHKGLVYSPTRSQAQNALGTGSRQGENIRNKDRERIMNLKELAQHVNESIKLRNPNANKVQEYAEKMEAGAVFPPIEIGYWPKSEKYGESGIVDGIHRLIAATQAKLTDFPTVSKKFQSLEEVLTYMYTANMAHGLPVTDNQRNHRIQLLKKMDPKLNIEKIGKMFHLGKSSIDRILKGEQGEGKSGPKGANKSAGQGTQDPMKASALLKSIARLNTEFLRKRPNQYVELAGYLSPVTKDHEDGELDKERFAEVEALIAHLEAVVKLVSM